MNILERRREERFFENRINFTLGPSDLDSRIRDQDDIVIVDVRSEEDYKKGHISGAINLPKERWIGALGLDKTKTNVLYCHNQQCHLATKGCLEFAKQGFKVTELEGGFRAWREAGFKVEESELRKAA